MDPMDLVRDFFAALNRADPGQLARLYHPACAAEHVFSDDNGVFEGSRAVCAGWADEFARYEGLLAGGHRIEVGRIAGIETGWGWVRADWRMAVRRVSDGAELRTTGYSHFWIEDAQIRRHRSVSTPELPGVVGPPGLPGLSSREFPTRPIVGVGAVIRGDDGRIVLVKRRYEPLAGQWSLPGGSLELGETLEAGTAREVVEETGLIVDVGPVIEVFDRILVDEGGKVRYHFVLVDYMCRPRGGELRAGSDVADVALAAPGELARFHVTDKVHDVVRRAAVL
jgi:ADP-ribose pyrophosphatase YjhB (NUDIX family)